MNDMIDIDVVVSVLSRTAFSPFFTILVPVFYLSQGHPVKSSIVWYSFTYWVAISAFWSLRWLSKVYRNGIGSLLLRRPLDWSEQIVLITGGSSGVGELLANTLAFRNVTVVVLDIKPIVTDNSNITFYQCDVSKWDEVKAVAKKVIEEVGHPTILVNNAGVVQGKLILDLKPQDIVQTFGVNTMAHFWTLKVFLPKMIERKSGHIVTLASVMGLVGSAQMTDYGASKAAVVNLHESLRYELDNRYGVPQIRTTILCPGHIHTPLFSTISTPQNFFYRFFVPSLSPLTVVKAIIHALDAHESRTIYLPFYTTSAVLMKTFPSFVRDLAQKLTYADFMMQNFRKVTAIREDEVKSAEQAAAQKKLN
ncbi:retinal short-chain dehydrogenase/reductase [Pisolithus croceorrhizus]|nr:retinal short-chain dehydrogenase/reductase [Pisolithus croceorrhizus]